MTGQEVLGQDVVASHPQGAAVGVWLMVRSVMISVPMYRRRMTSFSVALQVSRKKTQAQSFRLIFKNQEAVVVMSTSELWVFDTTSCTVIQNV